MSARYPVTVQRVWQARGYSGRDHELDDRPLRALSGRRYWSVSQLAEVAEQIRERDGWCIEPERTVQPPLRAELIYSDGTSAEVRLG